MDSVPRARSGDINPGSSAGLFAAPDVAFLMKVPGYAALVLISSLSVWLTANASFRVR